MAAAGSAELLIVRMFDAKTSRSRVQRAPVQ
jgi:hypothetical protein